MTVSMFPWTLRKLPASRAVWSATAANGSSAANSDRWGIRSGLARRKRTRGRDAQIVQAVIGGQSMRSADWGYGLDHTTVGSGRGLPEDLVPAEGGILKPEHGDPRALTFSQAQGYEEMPQRLKLEELSELARTKIWDALFSSLPAEITWADPAEEEENWDREKRWVDIHRDIHLNLDNLPLDQLNYGRAVPRLRQSVMTLPFNKVFDLIQFILRHPKCPTDLVDEMKEAFKKGMLAYIIDDDGPPAIFPAGTMAEGQSLVESLHTLQQAGLSTAEGLFREASMDINRGDWSGSIVNSIKAVESVARKLYPQTNTLGEALKELKKNNSLWPRQLVQAIQNVWNYTNQKEAGIRHGFPDSTGSDVGQDEALFMLGTCASIASYLWRKHPG